MAESPQSIFQRKRDLVYLVFFVVHLVVMLAFDLTSFYPASLKPMWMTTLRNWYIATYNDHFFYDPPAFFPLFSYLELLFHLPATLYLIPALLRNSPHILPLLLFFGTETVLSTAVCLVEMRSWSDLTGEQRGIGGLGGMYGGYAVFGAWMVVDCWMRLDGIVAPALAPAAEKRSGGGKKRV